MVFFLPISNSDKNRIEKYPVEQQLCMHTYEERCDTIANKSRLVEGPWMINTDGSLGVSHLDKFAPIKPRKSAKITKTDRMRKMLSPVGKKYMAKYSEEDRLFKKKMSTTGVKGKFFFRSRAKGSYSGSCQ